MKKLLLLLPFSIFNFQFSFAQTPGEWTWMKGDSVGSAGPVYGVQGIPAAANNPPAFYETVEWTDHNGIFWLYGGFNLGLDKFSDTWKFDPATNEWTWMNGPGLPDILPVFGVQGVPNPANNPGYDGWCAASFVDTAGNLWLFGGSQAGGANNNNLWKYDISINQWAWMKGTPGVQAGTYGTMGVPDPANNPAARFETNASWCDRDNHLWLFGGMRGGLLGDMWRYDIPANTWTWMSGTIAPTAGVYGIKGVAAATNLPSARRVYCKWKDTNDDLWFYGGQAFQGTMNDVWRFNIAANVWTWMGGDQTANGVAHYTSRCSPDSANIAAAKWENRVSWSDGNNGCFTFGGMSSGNGLYNDLWNFNPLTNEWTFINGDTIVNPQTVWGTQGVSSPANNPGGRMGSVAFRESNGNLWLYGGWKQGTIFFNDLWRYVPEAGCGSVAPPVANFVASDRHICPGMCISFSNFSSGATSYQWSFPGGTPSTSTDMNPTNVCYYTSGNYSVTLIATNAMGTDSITLNNLIEVYPQPTIPTIVQSGDTLFSPTGYSTYQWYFGSDTISGATDYFYVAMQSGNYNLVVLDDNGCAVGAGIVNVVASLTPALSKGEGVSVFPNPANDNITVTLFNIQSAIINLEIYNSIGEKVYKEETGISNQKSGIGKQESGIRNQESEIIISLKDFPSGIYLITISADGKNISRKFVKL